MKLEIWEVLSALDMNVFLEIPFEKNEKKSEFPKVFIIATSEIKLLKALNLMLSNYHSMQTISNSYLKYITIHDAAFVPV